MLLLERAALDLELDDAAVELVDLLGLRFRLHAEPRRRLVHQVDRLVGEEAVGDVTVRQGRRGDDRAVGDADAVMDLVLLLDAAQDRDRVLDRGLADEDRLETPRQRRVLLDVLPEFVERGGADAMQLATCEHGLQHVGRVHRALGLAGADERVQLVDEDDDLAFGGGDLGEDGLQALLELAAELGAGDERTQIERQEALFLQAVGHVAMGDAQRQSLDDRGLADARLADQDGIVLGPARQHLDGAADLLVAADDRVELPFARGGREVARIFLERVVAFLGARRVGAAAFADFLDRAVQILWADALARQRLSGRRALQKRHRQEQALGGDEAVACLFGDLLGLGEEARQFGRKKDLGAPAFDARHLVEHRLDRGQHGLRIAARGADQVGREAFLVIEQDFEEMFRRDLLMAAPLRQGLCRLHESLGPFGVFLELHDLTP